MKRNEPVAGADDDLTQVLGYLNFSSGRTDPKTLDCLNRLYGRAIWGSPYAGMPPWLSIQQWLQDRLLKLSSENPAFQQSNQAAEVLQLVWLQLLPSYLDFHRDLLFHQEPEALFNGFFIGRAMEAVLQQGGPWDEIDRIVPAAIRKLNDYVGFRPVAVLEGRRLEPYPHEWIRPIPLFVKGAGVTEGPYRAVVEIALRILEETDADIMHRAYLDLNLMDELALDPRAYDFDHPVNRRPNYHFGQWDPHCIDNAGYYRRFVVQQVTLDALLARLKQESLPEDQLLYEAAAVLAGTILMASGVSGNSPNTFPSTLNMATLLSGIAVYRDEFYDQLLTNMQGDHAVRLREEEAIRRQAFGGARQYLNQQLARQRASQLEHVQLARLFARMGHSTAAKEESDHVPVPAARLLCRIDCFVTAGSQALQQGNLKYASAVPTQIMDLLQRGIECGAVVDPWNILGFAGNFSRFHGPESAVRDHRVDDLVALMESIFALQSRIWREAAARNEEAICQRVSEQFRNTAEWWRKFAPHQVPDLDATDPLESYQSASLVATALRLWHAGGAATGDVRFWAPHAELFDSPKAYALVIEALLEREDFVAAMALLVHWLSQAEKVGLQSGSTTFSILAQQWLQRLQLRLQKADAPPQLGWPLVSKFFDYLEANSEKYWTPPEFHLATKKRKNKPDNQDKGLASTNDSADNDENDGSRFDSAYENVVYQDSTNDGLDSSLFEEGSDSEDELLEESRRIEQHLTFLNAIAHMWKQVAIYPLLRTTNGSDGGKAGTDLLSALKHWCEQAELNAKGLMRLLEDIHGHRIPRGGSDSDAMARYDRRRLTKESLVDRLIGTIVETSDARLLMLATFNANNANGESNTDTLAALPEDDRLAVRVFSQLMCGNTEQTKNDFPELIKAFWAKPLLYVPLARGGDPQSISSVRLRRRVMTHLLTWLPRAGLYFQAVELVETARHMEHNNPVGSGAVTEFDDLYKIAYKAMIRSLVRNAYAWQRQIPSRTTAQQAYENRATFPTPTEIIIDQLNEADMVGIAEPHSDLLIPFLEQLTRVMLVSWLSHSRTLRLSILETVENSSSWKRLVDFIQRYGGALFTQQFLRLSNVRAILHQGVGAWLDQVVEDGGQPEVQPLMDGLQSGEIQRAEAERQLSIVLEGIIDHYAEYRDYNSTTTQSDRGEMLYMLLDFLRLRVRYDRVSWNLRPVFWAHEIMVRSGCHKGANQWRRALSERIGREAEMYLEHLTKLQEKYAMRMPTVADRLSERFIKPMTVDRMRALIRPAIRQIRHGKEAPAFDMLVTETKALTKEPTGVGFDVPAWLQALEEEVDRALEHERYARIESNYDAAVPLRLLSMTDLEEQLNTAERQNSRLLDK